MDLYSVGIIFLYTYISISPKSTGTNHFPMNDFFDNWCIKFALGIPMEENLYGGLVKGGAPHFSQSDQKVILVKVIPANQVLEEILCEHDFLDIFAYLLPATRLRPN